VRTAERRVPDTKRRQRGVLMGKRIVLSMLLVVSFLAVSAVPASAATGSDLRISRTGSTFQEPILVGDQARVVGVAANDGPDTVTDFSIKYGRLVNLDVEGVRCVGIRGVEFSDPEPTGTAAGGNTCNFGWAEPGARAKMVLRVTTVETDPSRFFVSVRFCTSASDNVDPDTSNNCDEFRHHTG
jgi:hypothetical protein